LGRQGAWAGRERRMPRGGSGPWWRGISPSSSASSPLDGRSASPTPSPPQRTGFGLGLAGSSTSGRGSRPSFASSALAASNALRRGRRRRGGRGKHQWSPPPQSLPLSISALRRGLLPRGLLRGSGQRGGSGSLAPGGPWSLTPRCGASMLTLLSSASPSRRPGGGWLSGGSLRSAPRIAGGEPSFPQHGRAPQGPPLPPGVALQRWRLGGVHLGHPPLPPGGGGGNTRPLSMRATPDPSTARLFMQRAEQWGGAGMGRRGEAAMPL
jgi:hypothetical protein